MIGGGDYSSNRIVPDCVRSWQTSQSVKIRKPNSTRPWQHVLEPLSGYLKLGQELQLNDSINGQAFNFGPNSDANRTVLELIGELSAKDQTFIVDEAEYFNEAGLLQLNCEKAKSLLNWSPTLTFPEACRLTRDWYFAEDEKLEKFEISKQQIREYSTLARQRLTSVS